MALPLFLNVETIDYISVIYEKTSAGFLADVFV